jgi:WD40 repeat protein
MRKERVRRYRSVSELADDIQNYLSGSPLIAGPETAVYRVQKFVRRHSASVLTTALVVLAIVVGFIVSTSMYFRAERALNREATAREKEANARAQAERAEKAAEEKAESYRRLSYNYSIALADAKYREANMDSVRKLLDTCPEDLRGWEWDRLNYVSHQATMTLRAHSSWGVNSVTFSPDGRFMVSGGYDPIVTVWDAATGDEVKNLQGHTDYVNSVAFSPNGNRIASGGADKTIRVWDIVSGSELMALRGHSGEIYSVAFSPDGKRIASGGADDRTVRIWDVASGKELTALRGHNDEIIYVGFSHDGRRIVSSGEDKTIKLWDAVSGEEVTTLHGRDYSICVAFSPDDRKIISADADGVIRLRDAISGEREMAMRGHTGAVLHVAWSPDGKRIISCGRDNTVRIWDSEAGTELRILRGHKRAVSCASFSPDGNYIVSGSGDSTIKVWDAHVDPTQQVLSGHRDAVSNLAFTPDGKHIVSGSWDGIVKVWDVTSGAEKLTFHNYEGQVYSVTLGPDGKSVALGSQNGTIELWDIVSGEQMTTLRGHEGAIYAIGFSPDGKRIISGSDDMTVRIWSTETGDELMTLHRHNRPLVVAIAVSPDGKQIVAGTITGIEIWDAATGSELRRLGGHDKVVMHVAFSADGKRMVSSGWDKTVRVWDAATGDELTILEGHNDSVYCAAFSRDSKRVISAGQDGTVRVWDWRSGQEVMVMSGDTRFSSCAFSPDNQTFAAGGRDGNIVLWQRNEPPEGYSFRQITEKAWAIVDQLHRDHAFYHEVIDNLESDRTLAGAVRQVALQIANSRSWEDIDKLNKESWEIISSPNEHIDRYSTALQKAEKASRLEPDEWFVLNTLGVAQYRVGAYEDALETLTKTENMRDHGSGEADPVNLAFMAMTLNRLGRADDTRTVADRLRSLLDQGQYDNDYKTLACIVEAEKLIAGRNTKIAAVWEDIRLGKIDDASRVIEELRSSKGDGIASQIRGAIKWLGRAYYRRGRNRLNVDSEWAAKIADYEAAVRFDPNRAAALNDLAWLRATCPVSNHRDATRAVELANKACELTGWEDHEYISTLAAAYSEDGDSDAALNWQKKAADLLPEDFPPELEANYEARLTVYESGKPYRRGNLWSFSEGELIAHWTFDKVEGNKVLSAVGKNLYGKLTDDAHIVSDPEKGSVLSVGGDGADVEYDPALDITGSITVAVWVKTKMLEKKEMILVARNNWWLVKDDENHIRFGANFMGGALGHRWTWTGGSIDVNDGKWYHVVGVYDGSKVHSYVNGILDDCLSFEGEIVTCNEPLWIGGIWSPESQMSALIDDVRIYSYALSADQVKMLYEGEEPPREKRSE